MLLANTKRALQVLRAAKAALESAPNEKSLLDDVCRIVVEVGGYRFAWAGYAEEDAEKSVRFVAHAGHHADYLKQIHISWGNTPTGLGPAGNAIRTRKPSIVQHIDSSNEFLPWRESALAYGYHSVIALPLAWHESLFGCIAILSSEPDAFSEDESVLLTELASSISYGISALRTRIAQEQMEQALRAERDTQVVLRRILSLSLENLSLEEKLDRTLELLFDVPWLTLEHKGSVFLVNETNTSLRLVARRHLSPVLHTLCANVPFGHCLCGKAAASGELIYSQHIDEKHDTRFDGIEDHGHYCQPIRSSRGVIGVLNLYIAAGHQRNALEVSFLEAVADTLAGVIEREQAEQAQKRLVMLLEATPDLVTITDRRGNCLYCNASAQEIFSTQGGCVECDRNIFSHYPAEIARQVRDIAYPMAIDAGLWEGELELKTVNGGQMPVSLLVMSHRDSRGEVTYLSATARDITDRINAERAARSLAVREQNFANTLINNLPGIFYMHDLDGRLIRWNSNLETTLGFTASQLGSSTLRDLVPTELWPSMEQNLHTILNSGSAVIETELLDHTATRIPYYITGMLIEHSETGKGIIGIGIDISYRKQLEQELTRRATTDPLTGAYNRLKTEETLDHEINRSRRYHAPLSIAMFDIDYFKRVNDTYGHDAGDAVLKTFASITRAQLRDVDFLSRWGGEEFMIISVETSLDDMYNLAERVRRAVENSPAVEGISITASFGVGQYHEGESQKQLLKRVDEALYLAKNSGRNQVKIAG